MNPQCFHKPWSVLYYLLCALAIRQQPGRVGRVYLPTAFACKWWANDKAVYTPYMTVSLCYHGLWRFRSETKQVS